MSNSPSEEERAFQAACRLLERRALSRAELLARLRQRKFDAQSSQEAVKRSEELGFINDAELARWVASCPRFKLIMHDPSSYLRLLRDGKEVPFAPPGSGRAGFSLDYRAGELALSVPSKRGAKPPAGKFSFRYRRLDLGAEVFRRAELLKQGKITQQEFARQRVDIRGNELRSLVVPGDSQLTFHLSLKGDEKLVMDINLAPACWDGPGDGVFFAVYLNGRSEKHRLFGDYLDPKDEQGFKDWRRLKVNLAKHRELLRAGDNELRLVTEPGEYGDASFDYACWGDVHLTRPGSDRPDVVLVVFDALRADRLGCYGYERKTSPNLDALARGSMVFEKCYAASPWTKPSFQALFSSLYPSLSASAKDEVISPSYPVLGELVRRAGYYSVAFTANYYVKPDFGLARGFNRYYNFLDEVHPEHTFQRAIKFLKEG